LLSEWKAEVKVQFKLLRKKKFLEIIFVGYWR